MAEIVPTTLPQFYEAQKSLVMDLLDNKLTYSEAKERYKTMCGFIPDNVMMNPFYLDTLMKEKFEHEPEWRGDGKRIFNIEVGKIPDGIEGEEFIKKITESFKNPVLDELNSWYDLQSDTVKQEFDMEVLNQISSSDWTNTI